MTRPTNTQKVCAQNTTKDLCHANVPAVLLRLCKSDTKAASDHAAVNTEKAKHVWAKFNPEVSATQCIACSHFDTQCKGGQPKKLSWCS